MENTFYIILDLVEKKCKKIEEETKCIKAETAKLRKEREEKMIKFRLMEVENKMLLKQLNWENLTSEEIHFIMKNNKIQSVKLSVEEIKQLYKESKNK